VLRLLVPADVVGSSQTLVTLMETKRFSETLVLTGVTRASVVSATAVHSGPILLTLMMEAT
jgi:hypothetical protein